MNASARPGRRRDVLVRDVLPLLAAGAAAAGAYGALAALSRRAEHVPLAVYFAVLGVGWVALAVAWCSAGRRHGERARLRVWLASALLFRAIGLLAEPVLEDDHYRYLWDGRTFAVHGNPYGSPPADSFGDASVPPRFQAILDRINHPDLPTLYGPGAQVAFLAAYGISPGSLLPLKALLLACDATVVLLLLRHLGRRAALFYAWCPLAVLETGFNGHFDALGVALALAALLASPARRPVSAAVLLALATAVRPFAVLLLPFVAGRRPLAWGVYALVVLAAHAPFHAAGSGAGGAVLAVFARDWEFNSFVHAALAPLLGAGPSRIACGLLFALGYALVLVRHRARTSAAAPRALPRGDLVFAMLFLLAPVVNPWYLLWLLPFVAASPKGWGIGALLAVSLSYAHGGFLASPALAPYEHPLWVRPLELLLVAGGLAAEKVRHRRADAEGDRH